ncbi:putative ATP-dependent RNA helicase DHX35 [Dermatophagoides pteronyssinus]|uniref:putative ATP-dependent RNA helicase DHX35 n=1 Tax=Dermatophagoides pteronyssinus TaxID=6956 RepID=UPI003F670D6A
MSSSTGNIKQSMNEDRNENDHDFQTIPFNPNKSLSIEQQRLRLPIHNFKNHIAYLLEKYQVLIVIGETGCGKSTQLPQFLYEFAYVNFNETYGKTQIIGITQPRRIATISLAARVAEEMNVDLGAEVGYSIRFEDVCDEKSTKIKFMTEGILIREMMNDPLLTKYSIIIVDEAHERSVNTDILLSLLKKIIKKRADLKVIISSATLETESICNYFNTIGKQKIDRSTVLCIDGRAFPVEINFLIEPTADYVKESVETVIKIHENFPNGDVLVFLTGQEEVEETVESIFEYSKDLKNKYENYKKLLVFPLYASLPTNEQIKVFQILPRHIRKVIVATNIAEASVTIPGVSYVVDCGFVKIRNFNSKSATDSLMVVPITKASAQQRSGRAGRTKSGYSFRLYTEEEFRKLADFTSPEIERVSLSSTILQLKALGIDNIVKFDFISPPPSRNIIAAFDVLFALKAIDNNGSLTDPLGMQMAEFPLNPTFSKMLLVSEDFGCSEEILTIASMLQVQNIFTYPHGQRAQQARRAKHNLSVEEGDLITYLNIYNQFIKSAQIRSWSDKNYLHYKGLLRAVEIRNRLKSLLHRFKVRLISSTDVESILKCIVAGFFTNAAQLDEDGIYRTIRGNYELHIHPTSVLYTMKRLPKFVLFTEVIHTNKDYMKDISVIKPNWLYELAPHYYEFGTKK